MEQRYTEAPETISWVDSEQSKLTIHFTVIDAEKEKITVMINENGCYLSAPTEVVDYVATISFLYPVKPSEAKANYRDGYLTIQVPFKEPLKDYIKIPVE